MLGIQIILLLIAYLIGSIPSGLILTRLAGLGDVRNIGSGNIGATNVLRTGNKKLAATTLLMDMLKGAAAVYLVQVFAGHGLLDALAGLTAVLGHNFPIWLKFKGGKGVATTIGVLIALNPLLGAAIILTWLAVFASSRISSLSAIVSAMLAPVYAWALTTTAITSIVAMLSILIVIRHHANIRRLLKGEEPKFGVKK